MIESILIEGLIYGIMVLGVFITFRILDFADLTVDGSFPIGASIMGIFLLKGVNPFLALFVAFLGGLICGLITALIHTKLKIPGLLAGILTMTMVYSISLRIMSNRANISYLKVPTLFSKIQAMSASFLSPDLSILFFSILVVAVILVLLNNFFTTDFGLCMGALGSNPQMIISQGMNPEIIKAVGIALSNGLVAFSGALASMYQGFADVGSGSGIAIAGLASLMIGEFIIRSNKISALTFRVILGSILYRALMYLARKYGYLIHMNPNDLKLITGLLIILSMVISKTKFRKKPSVHKAEASHA